MAKCEFCKKEYFQKRSDSRFCSTKCRVYFHRREDKNNQMLPVVKKLNRLKKIAPGAAASASALILTHGVDCSSDAIKLALAAYYEGLSARG